MPNGCVIPCANTVVDAVLLPSAEGLSTLTRPDCVSATKISPFGAILIVRGPFKPLANVLTLNPVGTERFAVAGRSTRRGKLRAAGVSKGALRFATSIRWTRPGLSLFQSASPFDGATLAAAGAGGGP